jgi:hypothetical protein
LRVFSLSRDRPAGWLLTADIERNAPKRKISRESPFNRRRRHGAKASPLAVHVMNHPAEKPVERQEEGDQRKEILNSIHKAPSRRTSPDRLLHFRQNQLIQH